MDVIEKSEGEGNNNEKYEPSGICDAIFAVFLLIISFCFWNMVKIFNTGAGTTVFYFLFIFGSGIYFKLKKIKLNNKACIYLFISTIASLYFVIYNNILIEMLMFLVMFFYVLFWIAHLNGKLIDNGVSSYLLGDIYNLLLLIPFGNLNMLFVALKGFDRKEKKNNNFSAAVVGVLIMLPVLIVVISLLTKADAGFEKMINGFLDIFGYVDFSIIWKIIISVPTACYLGGIFFGCIYNSKDNIVLKDEKDEIRSNFKIAPRIGVYSALISMNFIYVLFIISQFGYLFDALNGTLPKELTYSEYARRGFFEICIITGINMMVLLLAHVFIKDNEKKDNKNSDIYGMLKIQSVILCIFTSLLIITAISKMVLYIWTYGLTYLRTFTSCFMIYMLFVVICVIVRQYKKYKLFRNIFIGAAIGVIVFGYANIDGIIAKYNINRYISGKEHGKNVNIDYDCLRTLSDGSTPYLKELYLSKYADENDKEQVETILSNYYDKEIDDLHKNESEEDTGFCSYNFMTARSIKIAKEILN